MLRSISIVLTFFIIAGCEAIATGAEWTHASKTKMMETSCRFTGKESVYNTLEEQVEGDTIYCRFKSLRPTNPLELRADCKLVHVVTKNKSFRYDCKLEIDIGE